MKDDVLGKSGRGCKEEVGGTDKVEDTLEVALDRGGGGGEDACSNDVMVLVGEPLTGLGLYLCTHTHTHTHK